MRVLFIVSGFAASCAVTTLAAGAQAPPPDAGPATPLEHALTERACNVIALGADRDAEEACVAGRLATLRADFGPGLRQLSERDRKGLDSACSRLNTAVTREAYLDCLNARLAELGSRLPRTNAAAETPNASAPAPAPVAAVPPRPDGARLGAIAEGAAVAGVAIAAAAGFVVWWRSQRICTTCGQRMRGEGDTCAACLDAAAANRAAAERAEVLRQQVAARRQRAEREEREEKERALAAQRAQEETQRINLAEVRRRHEEAEAVRRRADEEAARRARESPPPPASSAAPFDPYAVLGLPGDADLFAIRAAYVQAKSRYDLESVSHLGEDVQQHYRDKAEAVDRAYEMLVS